MSRGEQLPTDAGVDLMMCGQIPGPESERAFSQLRHFEWCTCLLSMTFLLVAPSLGFAASRSKPSQPAGAKIVSLEMNAGSGSAGQPLKLRAADARQQLLVSARFEDGRSRDVTRAVSYEVKPARVVNVDTNGFVTALGDGTATITARVARDVAGTLSVTVEKFHTAAPVNFPNQIVPIFTKAGCNGGGCHGKSGGQNGFRLSLLGFEPGEDYEHLVKEARGRRVFPASPDRSLLLMKGTAALPHGGGKRLDPNSDDYRLLVGWIRQGMPDGNTKDPRVDHIEVFPGQRTIALGAQQQLSRGAHY